MNGLSNIRQSIINLAKLGQKTSLFTAKVEKVDGEKCSVSVEGLTLSDVRLRAVINDENSKLLITPKVGSYVLVTDLSGGGYSDLAVLSFSEIDKIDIDLSGNIKINGGENDGLVKVRELEKNLDKIKDYLDSLNTAIAAGLTGTVGNQGAAASATFTSTMQACEMVFENMENEKIKH